MKTSFPHSTWASHVKRTGAEYFINTYSAAIRVETGSNAVIISSAESNIANPLLTNSAKEDEGIVKPPRDKLSKYLFSKWIPFSLTKQDLQIMQLERLLNFFAIYPAIVVATSLLPSVKAASKM